jgi:hypothetical protein
MDAMMSTSLKRAYGSRRSGIRKIRGWLLHLAQMRLAVPAMDPGRQHEAVHPHEPPNALAVVARAKRAVHHRPHPGDSRRWRGCW